MFDVQKLGTALPNFKHQMAFVWKLEGPKEDRSISSAVLQWSSFTSNFSNTAVECSTQQPSTESPQAWLLHTSGISDHRGTTQTSHSYPTTCYLFPKLDNIISPMGLLRKSEWHSGCLQLCRGVSQQCSTDCSLLPCLGKTSDHRKCREIPSEDSPSGSFYLKMQTSHKTRPPMVKNIPPW